MNSIDPGAACALGFVLGFILRTAFDVVMAAVIDRFFTIAPPGHDTAPSRIDLGDERGQQ